MSVAIVSVIMGAMFSTMLLATRQIGSGLGIDERVSRGSDVVQQITLDLSLAQTFTERTDRTVAFTVPDRDGDGEPESIRYAWSGVAGDPLTRQYNGGPTVLVAEDVHHFRLDYLLKTPPSPAALGSPEGEKIARVFHDGLSGRRAVNSARAEVPLLWP